MAKNEQQHFFFYFEVSLKKNIDQDTNGEKIANTQEHMHLRFSYPHPTMVHIIYIIITVLFHSPHCKPTKQSSAF